MGHPLSCWHAAITLFWGCNERRIQHPKTRIWSQPFISGQRPTNEHSIPHPGARALYMALRSWLPINGARRHKEHQCVRSVHRESERPTEKCCSDGFRCVAIWSERMPPDVFSRGGNRVPHRSGRKRSRIRRGCCVSNRMSVRRVEFAVKEARFAEDS